MIGTIALLPTGNNPAEAVNLCAIFSFNRTVAIAGAGHHDQTLAGETERIIGIVIDRTVDAVLGDRLGAAADRGQTAKTPADPRDTVTGIARIIERQRQLHPRCARRHFDWDRI